MSLIRKNRDFASNLAKLRQRIGRKVEVGLHAVGNDLLEHSLPLVPLDTTYLYETGRVQVEGSGFGTVVQVGYGWPGFPPEVLMDKHGKQVLRYPWDYARRVHEDMNIPHEHGQANYLLTAVVEQLPYVTTIFVSAANKVT